MTSKAGELNVKNEHGIIIQHRPKTLIEENGCVLSTNFYIKSKL